MTLPTSLDELLRHQARAREIAGRTLALLGRGDAAARASLAQARWEAMRILREYQLYKHYRIFDPAIAERSYRSPRAQCMKDACARIGDAYVAHTTRWANVDDWPAYRQATEEIIQAILRHLEQERRGVIALLALPQSAERTRPSTAMLPSTALRSDQSQKRTGT